MKGKAVLSILLILVAAVCMLGCGGGGGSSNPAASKNLVGNATVTGYVYNANDKPVVGAAVRMVSTSNAVLSGISNNRELASARFAISQTKSTGIAKEFNTNTDAKGKYTFTGVPEGDYTLSANTSDGAQIISNLSVRAATVEAEVMQLKPMGTIEGQVTVNGDAAVGSIVYLQKTSYAAIVDASGNFTISGVPVATDFVLCVQSSDGTANSQNVNISDLKTLKATVKTITLTPTTGSACQLNVSLTSQADNIDLTKCVVFAVNSDGTTYLAPCKKNGSNNSYVSSFKISHEGSYTLFPAYYDNDIVALTASPSTDIVTVNDSNMNSGTPVEKAFRLVATTSAFGRVEGKMSSNATGNYTAVLLDTNGNEYKKSVSDGSNCLFDNLLTGTYTLIIYNDTQLYINKDINAVEGEKVVIDNIAPVDVTPTIANATSGQVKFTPGNIKKAVVTSLANPQMSSSIVAYTPVAHNKDNDQYVNLFNYDDGGEPVLQFLASEAQTETLYTDKCSSGNYSPAMIVAVLNSSNTMRPAFVVTFDNASADLGTNLWKTVTLRDITQNENIILFKKIINTDNSLNYLVVTSSNAYIFNESGAKLHTTQLPGTVTPDNAVFVESDGTSPNLLIVQIYSVTDHSVLISATEVIDGETSGFGGRQFFFNNGATGADSYVYSANNLVASYGTENGTYCLKIVSAMDKRYFNFYLDPADFSEIEGINRVSDDLFTYTTEGHSIIASSSRVVCNHRSDEDYYDFVFLTYEHNYIGIGKKSYGSNLPYTNCIKRDFKYQAMPMSMSSMYSCGGYELYALYSRSDFPFLTTSFNGVNNQVLVYSASSNEQVECIYDEYSSLHMDNKIKTSYKSMAADRSFCIVRDSNGQFFKNYDSVTNEETQSVKIYQILNASSYLEECIEIVEINSDRYQTHLLCTNASGNVQVMVIEHYKGI